MRPISSPLAAAGLLAAVATLAGCATRDSREAAYEKSLAQWQGQGEDLLLARWGRPMAQEPGGGANSKWLVYVVSSGTTGGTSVGFSVGGFGFGGGHVAGGVGLGAAVPVSPGQPVLCTTRFLVEDGKVSSWNFEGPGCGDR